MKIQTRSFLLCAGILIASLPSAHADLIAYEGFDYPQLTRLASSANTGTGWTASWTSNSWRTNNSAFGSSQPGGFENSSGLSYTGLITVGNTAREENLSQSFRTFAPQAATGTYWISFLMQQDQQTGGGSHGISFFDGGTERNFMGRAASDVFGTAGTGAFASSTTVTLTPSLFVARYNMDTGIAHYWLNSDLSLTTPTDASAFNGAGGTGFTAFTFDRIRLGAFGPRGYLDEIRLGTTSQDVGFAIADPSTALAAFRTDNSLEVDGSQDLLTPAGDGVTNLVKFAFNMIGAGAGQAGSLNIPNVASFNGTAGLPLVGTEVGTGKLQITYLRRKTANSPTPGISYSVQFGSTLADFAINPSATEVLTSINAIFESVTVTDSVLPPSKRFARVKITAP